MSFHYSVNQVCPCPVYKNNVKQFNKVLHYNLLNIPSCIQYTHTFSKAEWVGGDGGDRGGGGGGGGGGDGGGDGGGGMK